jgi:hypothetical protein
MDISQNVQQACRNPLLRTKSISCDKPLCKRYEETYCNATFYLENGQIDVDSLPAFPENTLLSEYFGVDQTVGGGKSGAYIFRVCSGKCSCSNCNTRLCNPSKSNPSQLQRKLMLKVYPFAFDRNKRVSDVGPFTEVYTQCMMSGFQGFTCMVCYGVAAWSSVSNLFTNTLDNDTHCVGDMVGVLPTPRFVLYQVTTIAPGKPLLASSMLRHPTKLLGCMLQIMAVWQTARNRMGKEIFTHWDFHPDNIFVDWECNVRPPQHIPTLNTLMRRSQALFTKVANYMQMAKRPWEATEATAFEAFMKTTLDTITRVVTERVTGVNIPVHGISEAVDKHTKPMLGTALNTIRNKVTQSKDLGPELQGYVTSIIDQISEWVALDSFVRIEYPKVTIIDFDLVTSARFPERRPKHEAKLRSLVPVTERAVAFLLCWLPAAKVMHWLTMLTVGVKEAKVSLDYAHMLSYAYVFFVYHIQHNVLPNTSINNICTMVATAWGNALQDVIKLISSMDMQAVLLLSQQFAGSVSTSLTSGLGMVTNQAVAAFGVGLSLKSLGAAGMASSNELDTVKTVAHLYTQGRDVIHTALTGDFRMSALAERGMHMLFKSGQTTPLQFMRTMQAHLHHMTTMYHRHTRMFPNQDALFVAIYRIPLQRELTKENRDIFIKHFLTDMKAMNMSEDLANKTSTTFIDTLEKTLAAISIKDDTVRHLRCTLNRPQELWVQIAKFVMEDHSSTLPSNYEDATQTIVTALSDYLSTHYTNTTMVAKLVNRAAGLIGYGINLKDVIKELISRTIIIHLELPNANPLTKEGWKDAPKVTMSLDGGSTMVFDITLNLHITVGFDKSQQPCEVGIKNPALVCIDNQEPVWTKDTAMYVAVSVMTAKVQMFPNGALGADVMFDLPEPTDKINNAFYSLIFLACRLIIIIKIMKQLLGKTEASETEKMPFFSMLSKILKTLTYRRSVDSMADVLQELLHDMLDLAPDSVSAKIVTGTTQLRIQVRMPKGDPLHCVGGLGSILAGDPNIANILDCVSFISPANGFSILYMLKEMLRDILKISTTKSELSVDLFLGDLGASLGAQRKVYDIDPPEPLSVNYKQFVDVDNKYFRIHEPLVHTRFNPISGRRTLEAAPLRQEIWAIHTATMILSAINKGIDTAEKFEKYATKWQASMGMTNKKLPTWLGEFYKRTSDVVSHTNGKLHNLRSIVTYSDQVTHAFSTIRNQMSDVVDSATFDATLQVRKTLEKAKEVVENKYTEAIGGLLDLLIDVSENMGNEITRNTEHYVKIMLHMAPTTKTPTQSGGPLSRVSRRR